MNRAQSRKIILDATYTNERHYNTVEKQKNTATNNIAQHFKQAPARVKNTQGLKKPIQSSKKNERDVHVRIKRTRLKHKATTLPRREDSNYYKRNICIESSAATPRMPLYNPDMITPDKIKHFDKFSKLDTYICALLSNNIDITYQE